MGDCSKMTVVIKQLPALSIDVDIIEKVDLEKWGRRPMYMGNDGERRF